MHGLRMLYVSQSVRITDKGLELTSEQPLPAHWHKPVWLHPHHQACLENHADVLSQGTQLGILADDRQWVRVLHSNIQDHELKKLRDLYQLIVRFVNLYKQQRSSSNVSIYIYIIKEEIWSMFLKKEKTQPNPCICELFLRHCVFGYMPR
jgi:hypothetical protein